MSNPVKALTTLIGREPTPEEMEKIYKIKEQLGLADHDVVWSFLIAFGQYEILYSEIPAKIETAVLTILTEFRISAEAAAGAVERQMRANVESSVSETVRKLSEQVIATGQQIANSHNRRKLAIAIAISLGVAAIAIAIVLWAGYRLGASSKDAELAWLNTPQGQAAKEFAQINDIPGMMACDNPLKQITSNGKKYCMPYDESKKQVRTWRIQ